MFLKTLIEHIFREGIKEVIGNHSTAIGSIKDIPIRIEKAREEKFGDYAILSAMDKDFRELVQIKNPKELAQNWIEKIKTLKINVESLPLDKEILYLIFNKKVSLSWDDVFESIEIAGSGFINVFINKKIFLYFLFIANQEGESYGRIKKQNPNSIIFEFVSANPTGPLNIVSARAAALGDSCCNLLEAIGENVYREYYVNDYGNQIELLGISLLFRFLEKEGIPLKFSIKEGDKIFYPASIGLPFPKEGYHGSYILLALESILQKNPISISPEERERLWHLSQQTGLDEKDLPSILNHTLRTLSQELSEKAIDFFLQQHKEDLSKFRVRFDNFFKESDLHRTGKVKEIIQKIQPYTYYSENKLYFRSTEFGDDQDRVILRDNGKPTYLLADIAYHDSKIQRNFNKLINIWGPDHHGYIARLKGAVKALGFPEESFIILIAQQVTLVEDGKPIVMSKRTGRIIQMKDLLEEIPIDVARYFFILRSFEAHLEFDLNQAKDTSDKNPYYYIAYAHARIHSLFKKYFKENTIDLDRIRERDYFENIINFFNKLEISRKNTYSETYNYRRDLLLDIARFPEEVYDAAMNLEPHKLALTLYKMANDFAKFYGIKENKIIEKEKEEAVVLIYILNAIKTCLKNGLKLLGTEAPERLEKENATI
ncbi:MAG: arginine--tRNA ligase [Leptonema sp. (in: bacteria)]